MEALGGPPDDRLDTQQVELVARAALEAELIRQGFEVARPNRDKGIDLIVYLDEHGHRFSALPIQMKASRSTGFGVWRKYEHVSGLIIAYVWEAMTRPQFFIMNFAEAAELVRPYHSKHSWTRDDGQAGWRFREASSSLVRKLAPYRDRWAWLREQLCPTGELPRAIEPTPPIPRSQLPLSGQSDTERVVEALRALAPSLKPARGEEWSQSPSLKVIDCVLSLNRAYDRMVVPRLKRFKQAHPEVQSVSDLRDALARYPSAHAFVQDALNYNHALRATILSGVVERLIEIGGTGTSDEQLARMESWAATADPLDYRKLAIKGFGIAGYQYLRMLFGANTSKPDLRICQWVSGVVGHPVRPVQALRLLEHAAPIAGVNLRDADAYIWERLARGLE